MKCYKVIGYYICELCDTPEWLQGISRQILSVSGCIGGSTPDGNALWADGEKKRFGNTRKS